MSGNKKKFIVCSPGGCGSTHLCKLLNNHGETFHVHTRNPPRNLTYVDKKRKRKIFKLHEWFGRIKPEWFGRNRITEESLKDFTVVFLYRDIKKILISTWFDEQHLTNIQTEKKSLKKILKKLKDTHAKSEEAVRKYLELTLKEGSDLIDYYGFLMNYIGKPHGNYKVIAVNFDLLMSHKEKFICELELPEDFFNDHIDRAPALAALLEDDELWNPVETIFSKYTEKIGTMDPIEIF